MAELEHPLRPMEILQAVRAEVQQRRAVGQTVGDEIRGCVRHENLATVSARAQPCAPNDGVAEVVALVAELRVAGVQRDPDCEVLTELVR